MLSFLCCVASGKSLSFSGIGFFVCIKRNQSKVGARKDGSGSYPLALIFSNSFLCVF